MNQENFDYLKNQVKFTGFGDSLENDLKAAIEKQAPTFQLKYPHDFGKDETVSTLNFRKSDTNDMYFFNNYNLSVKPYGEKEPVAQTFYVGKENTFTLKEGYNLLNGRSVNKDLVNKEKEGYNAWVKLDFKDADTNGNYKLKHYTENYGYKLSEELGKLPIKELGNADDKASLIESLQKGNRQSVTFLTEGGSEEKRFIEANAQYKSINQYDGSMKKIVHGQKEGETQGQSSSEAKKAKQGRKDDAADAPKNENKNKKKQGHKVS